MTAVYHPHQSGATHSAINHLPVELLVDIFSLSIHGCDTDQSAHALPFEPESITMPLVLSSVNRHWRSIVMYTPTLWTNICVTTGDIMNTNLKGSSFLDTRCVSSCLYLSQNASIDILIDARDPDWDFSEADPSEQADFNTYQHPFTPSHIHTVFDHLLPHLSRWRSLTILTDQYAPIYASLLRLGSHKGADYPIRLESLKLMRCNEYIAHSSEFTPRALKSPLSLPFEGLLSGGNTILPRLRDLSLIGVHVNWATLPYILPRHYGMDSLELSYHASEVRPGLEEFRNILRACPGLKKLVVRVSGPEIDQQDALNLSGDKVLLPMLSELTLAYTDAVDACTMLSVLHAPNLKTLVLEDGSHTADPADEDAGCLLTYCGTGNLDVAPPSGSRYPQDPSPEANDTQIQTRAIFPNLETVTLDRVLACANPYKTIFAALPHLRKINLVSMSTHAVEALLPSPTGKCPCPALQSLCIRGASEGLDFLIGGLPSARAQCGAKGLKRVAVYLSILPEDGQIMNAVHMIDGTRMEVFAPDVDLEDVEMDECEDPYAEGGAFNDPDFDEYYGSMLTAH